MGEKVPCGWKSECSNNYFFLAVEIGKLTPGPRSGELLWAVPPLQLTNHSEPDWTAASTTYS